MNKMVKKILFHTLGIVIVLSLITSLIAGIAAFDQREAIRLYKNSESHLKSTYLPIKKHNLLRDSTIAITGAIVTAVAFFGYFCWARKRSDSFKSIISYAILYILAAVCIYFVLFAISFPKIPIGVN